MPRKHARKTNPRRIPLSKSTIEKETQAKEICKDDFYHAWLLVLNAMLDHGFVSVETMPELFYAINHFMSRPISSPSLREKRKQAEKIMGISNPCPHISTRNIHSAHEMEAYKRNLSRRSMYLALCEICVELEALHRFSESGLRMIFMDADLTLAEIQRGLNSYDNLLAKLSDAGIEIERAVAPA